MVTAFTETLSETLSLSDNFTRLSKGNILSGIFNIIYDRLISNVNSVVLSDGNTSTIKKYTGAFPESEVKDAGDGSKELFPILVVNSPNLSWEPFTLTKKNVNGTFVIDIYTTKAESSDRFIETIINSLETYRDTLGNVYGITFVNLESTDYDHVMRGKIKIHLRSCTFGFKYKFTKTAGT